MSQTCWQVTNWNASDATYSGPAPAVPVWGNPQGYSWPGPFGTACSGPLVSDYPDRSNPGAGLACLPGWWCGEFANSNYGYANFDNIGVSWMTIMYTMSTSGWTDVMYQAMDCLSPAIWVYFTTIVVLTSWFASNLAVAVLYVEFAQKDAPEPPPPTKDNLDIEEAELKVPADSPWGRARRFVRRQVVAQPWFGTLTVIAIICNSVMLAMIYYGESITYGTALDVGNIILTVYFVIEMALKVVLLSYLSFICRPVQKEFSFLPFFLPLLTFLPPVVKHHRVFCS